MVAHNRIAQRPSYVLDRSVPTSYRLRAAHYLYPMASALGLAVYRVSVISHTLHKRLEAQEPEISFLVGYVRNQKEVSETFNRLCARNPTVVDKSCCMTLTGRASQRIQWQGQATQIERELTASCFCGQDPVIRSRARGVWCANETSRDIASPCTSDSRMSEGIY